MDKQVEVPSDVLEMQERLSEAQRYAVLPHSTTMNDAIIMLGEMTEKIVELTSLAAPEEIHQIAAILREAKKPNVLIETLQQIASVGTSDSRIQVALKDAVNRILKLSAKKLVTGSIEGGVLSMDACEGVEFDIRDYDTESEDELLEEDEHGSYFQAG